MIRLDTHYLVDAGELACWVPHEWWKNIRAEAANTASDNSLSVGRIQQLIKEYGGYWNPVGQDVVTFEDERSVTLFLLRWS